MLVHTIGNVSPRVQKNLRDSLIAVYSGYEYYRELFHRHNQTLYDLQFHDPICILKSLPLMDSTDLNTISAQSINVTEDITDIETSSGTTGNRKIRLISYLDEEVENHLLARMLEICGIGTLDRVACVDIGPLTLMVSFTSALDELGVGESYAYGITANLETSIVDLFYLNPTVIITLPSILSRSLKTMLELKERGALTSLQKVIFVGEPLPPTIRETLAENLGIEVFGYYGASETSALGIECRKHEGIHIFSDDYIFETDASKRLVVTTLKRQGLPLIRYNLGDLIEVVPGHCDCGLQYPRINIIGKSEAVTSIFGVKINYASIRNACLSGLPGICDMSVNLTGTDHQKMTIVLPDELSKFESHIRTSISTKAPDLAYLIGAGFLDLVLDFTSYRDCRNSRKQQQILDFRNT